MTMALLSKEERIKRYKYLGYEYSYEGIKKFQKKAFPNQPKQQDGKHGINTDRALRHFYNVKKCTTNFSPEEFKCTCGHCTGYPTYMKQVELKHLQKIRNHYNKPMTITSGLRCSYENNRVGGVRNSGHLRGYAADFYMQGVTDTVANRKKSMSWIKKQDNHEFTYGADMKDSNGMYRTASGMGNAMHTETHAPKLTQAERIMAACMAQAKHMKNYRYHWNPFPTILNSIKEGTCVTFVACVLQRLGYLKSGKYIWHNTKGKVTHATSRMKIMYPGGTLKSNKKRLRPGDIVIAGKKSDVGSGSHIFFITGKWTKKNNPYIWDNHSCERIKHGKSGVHTYDGDKKVIAIIRLK